MYLIILVLESSEKYEYGKNKDCMGTKNEDYNQNYNSNNTNQKPINYESYNAYSNMLKDKKYDYEAFYDKNSEGKKTESLKKNEENNNNTYIEEKYFKRDYLNEPDKNSNCNTNNYSNNFENKIRNNNINKNYADLEDYNRTSLKDRESEKDKENKNSKNNEYYRFSDKHMIENSTTENIPKSNNHNNSNSHQNILNRSIENRYKRASATDKKLDSFRNSSKERHDFQSDQNNSNSNKFKRFRKPNNEDLYDNENLDAKKNNFDYSIKEKKVSNSELDENSEDFEYKKFLSNRLKGEEEYNNYNFNYNKDNDSNYNYKNERNKMENSYKDKNETSQENSESLNNYQYYKENNNYNCANNNNSFKNLQDDNVFSPKFNFKKKLKNDIAIKVNSDDNNNENFNNIPSQDYQKNDSIKINRNNYVRDYSDNELDASPKAKYNNRDLFNKEKQNTNKNQESLNNSEDQSNNEDSFEKKVKNLQAEKNKTLRKKSHSNTNGHGNGNGNINKNENDRKDKFKSTEKSKKNKINSSSNKLNESNKMRNNNTNNGRNNVGDSIKIKNSSKAKLETTYKPKIVAEANLNANQFGTIPSKANKSIIKNSETTGKNINSEFEINKLKKENQRLFADNKKLKEDLLREKQKNHKFKSFAEELIKFYEYY